MAETPRGRMATDDELAAIVGVPSPPSLPQCTTKEDLEQHKGSRVRVVGVLQYTEPGQTPRRGKRFLGVMLLLKDSTPVVLSYYPPQPPVRKLKGRRVAATGLLLPEAPDPTIQALLAYHMVGLTSLTTF